MMKTEDIAAALIAHQEGPAHRDGRWRCTCGWKSNPGHKYGLAHHQSEVIAELSVVTNEQRQELADRVDEHMETKYGFVLGTEDRDVYINALLHVIGNNNG